MKKAGWVEGLLSFIGGIFTLAGVLLFPLLLMGFWYVLASVFIFFISSWERFFLLCIGVAAVVVIVLLTSRSASRRREEAREIARIADEQRQAERSRREQEEAERREQAKQDEARARQAGALFFREEVARVYRETYGVKMTDAEWDLLKTISCKSPAERDEAWADWQEVKRFYADRLDLEPFVVGDEQTEIRSPYEVEMTPSEKALLDTISSRFDPSCVLVDTYLDKGDGTTTQVDIIAVCRQGVIVIESKGLGGTWSGRWDDKEWTQQSSRQRIYNPIRQNSLHVDSICRVLWPTEVEKKLPEICSLTVFNDDARFPDLRFLPEGCYVTTARRANDAIDRILAGPPVFTDTQVMEIAYIIRRHRILPDRNVRDAHIRDIQRAIGRDRVLE